MTIKQTLQALVHEGHIAADELGYRWKQSRGAGLMTALEAAFNLLYGNVCKCGELKGNHSGEQAMGECKKSGCRRYKPVEWEE